MSGDFSNFGLTPTSLGTLTLGDTSVFGTTGRGPGGMDRDYFTFVVPTGSQWVSFREIAGTGVGAMSLFWAFRQAIR